MLNLSEGKYTLSWDDDKVLFLGTEDDKGESSSGLQTFLKAKQLRSLEAKKQITALSGFGDFLHDQKDISIWVNVASAYATLDEKLPSHCRPFPLAIQPTTRYLSLCYFGFPKRGNSPFSPYPIQRKITKSLLDKHHIGESLF